MSSAAQSPGPRPSRRPSAPTLPGRPSRRFPVRVAGAAAVGLFAVLGIGAPVAWADQEVSVTAQQPEVLTSTVTDNAGVLDAGQTADLEAKIRDYQKSSAKKIYVVFERDFGGTEGSEWAEREFRANDGANVLVYAVAVESRDYGLSYGREFSSSEAERMRDAAYDRLVDSDFAGSAFALVDAASGSGSGGGMSGAGWLFLLGGGGAAAATFVGVKRSAKKNSRKKRAALVTDARELPPEQSDRLEDMPLDVLEELAREELVSTDESIRGAREELDLAVAEFGAERTRPFTRAMNDSTGTLQRAFAMRKRLDDAVSDDPATRRSILLDIITSCKRADQALEARAGEFGSMRNLLLNAGDRLDELTRKTIALRTRLPEARESLTRLHDRFDTEWVSALDDNPDLAEAHLDESESTMERARELAAKPAGQQGGLVDDIRHIESALQQAEKLMDGVEHGESNIRAARANLGPLAEEIRDEISEARRIISDAERDGLDVDHSALAEITERAERESAEAVERAGGDPLGAWDTLLALDAELDEHLDAFRSEAADAGRRRDMFNRAMGTATSTLQAAEDLISTRGRVIGGTARTHLAAAKRLHATALNERDGDLRAATRAAGQCVSASNAALAAAQRDIRDYERRMNRRNGGGNGAFVAGMVLNSILSNGGRGGGFGGGGGGFGGGGNLGGSFGGKF
ncbi:TPM domain-containing protein [Corynebacterium pygosceleis]|uniref:TPM domain-containing protein n=1 Tax=Corynebacterium pygosceleis TaxID=2800406 RepID=UPI001906FCE5|nr:TPM domain-containing protein [Corynebacterium pygosceleis]MCL0120677.1 TPM domain-containing protein [Corynebacterium pygosceleis]